MTLPYSYDALEPYMSAETLHYHHDKHHQAYVDMLNKLLPGSGFEGKSLEEIVKASYGKNQGVFNNAAQDFNHNQFWPWMKKGGGGKKVPGSVLAHGVVDNVVVSAQFPPVRDFHGAIDGGIWQGTFQSRTNWNYLLQASDNLFSWTNISRAVSGNSQALSVTDTNASLFRKHFYRIHAAPKF
jgi:hypothetical protein